MRYPAITERYRPYLCRIIVHDIIDFPHHAGIAHFRIILRRDYEPKSIREYVLDALIKNCLSKRRIFCRNSFQEGFISYSRDIRQLVRGFKTGSQRSRLESKRILDCVCWPVTATGHPMFEKLGREKKHMRTT